MAESNNQVVVGLDIGTTKICAIVGTRNENGKIHILGIGKSPSLGGVREGMVQNFAKTAEAIKKAVADATKMSNHSIDAVYVGIAGRHIKSFTQHFSQYRKDPNEEITFDELEQMRLNMYRLNTGLGNKIIHVLPQEFEVDGNKSDDPEGMAGTELEVYYHIITGQISAAENIKRCVERCHIQVEDIVVEPIASAKSVLTEDEMKAGVAILDIGGGTSDLAIFHDGRIRHTKVIPIGGQLITQDIMEAFMVMEEHAENMKVKYGNAFPDSTKPNEVIVVPGINGRAPKQVSTRNLSKVINARLMELFSLVDQEIRSSQYMNKLTAGLVVTGGGAELKNIVQILEFCTALDVKIGYPNQHITKGMVSEVKSPMYATGLGLVMYGLEKLDPLQIPQPTATNTQNKRVAGTRDAQNPIITRTKNFFGSFMEYLKEEDSHTDDFK